MIEGRQAKLTRYFQENSLIEPGHAGADPGMIKQTVKPEINHQRYWCVSFFLATCGANFKMSLLLIVIKGFFSNSKRRFMGKLAIKQEVLLLSHSSFTQMELCEKGLSDDGRSASPGEKLEEACWNGLLPELLRGVPVRCNDNGKMFLWKTHVGDTFLFIELSKTPTPVDSFYSLDPYLFLPLKNYN